MRAFIKYSKPSCVSGRALRTALEIDGGIHFPKDVSKYDTLIRWGSSGDSYMDEEFQRVINTAKNVVQSANRQHMFQRLARHIPGGQLLWHSRVPYSHDNSTLTMLRHRFGRYGKDIELLGRSDERWDEIRANYETNGMFSVQFWPADYEVRVHIVDGNSVSMQVKARRNADGTPTHELIEANKLTIRNDANGWGLWPLSNSLAALLGIHKPSIREQAKQVIRLFNLQFGVVDFLVRTPAGKYNNLQHETKILEINTAPGVDGQTLERYISSIRTLLAKPIQATQEGAVANPFDASVVDDPEDDYPEDDGHWCDDPQCSECGPIEQPIRATTETGRVAGTMTRAMLNDIYRTPFQGSSPRPIRTVQSEIQWADMTNWMTRRRG